MKYIRHYLLHLVGWLYSSSKLFRVFFFVLVKDSWKQGYFKACRELKSNKVHHWTARQRMKTFSPPALYCYDPDMLDAWDAGYKRAITLHRLKMKPSRMWRAQDPLALPYKVPQLEEIVLSVRLETFTSYLDTFNIDVTVVDPPEFSGATC